LLVLGILVSIQFFLSSVIYAQSNIPFLKEQVRILAGPGMYGRGYLDGGGDSAARYISDQFGQYSLRAFGNNYYQPYTFPVNSFPGITSLRINKKTLQPGKDFMVHAASSAVVIRNKKPIPLDLAGIKDSISWQAIRNTFGPDRLYLLSNIDTVMKYNKLTIRQLARSFDRGGTFILPMRQKLIWLATTDTVPSTIIFTADSIMPRKMKRVYAEVQTRFIPAFCFSGGQ
jgi:hypothetical protein